MFSSRAKWADSIAGHYIDYSSGTRRASAAAKMETPPPVPFEPSLGKPAKPKHPGDQARKYGVYSKKVTLVDDDVVLSDDDIIIITVKITKKERRNSFDDPLPDRPQKRGFMARIGTRIITQGDQHKYKAVKLPRGEYVKHFRHDHEGTYTGTEPQREWTEAEIDEAYGQYQDVPLTGAMSVRGVSLAGGIGNGGLGNGGFGNIGTGHGAAAAGM